ncbi:MAG: hypothetical protein JWP31_1376 [Aeromicrobium sp.]|nr:hypothetical protein [Aeromicrobium sp.]
MVVISPWKRRKHAAVEAARNQFMEECGPVLDPLLAPLGFHAGRASYSVHTGDISLFFEIEDEAFVSRYPGGGVDVIEAGGVEVWVTFHPSSGTFEAHSNAGDFYMDDRDVPGSPDWRVDVKPVLLAIAEGHSEDLRRLRDENAADRNPRTRPFGERRGGAPLRRVTWRAGFRLGPRASPTHRSP